MDINVKNKIIKNIALEMYKNLNNNKPVIMCVGSDKFVMDSLGPIVAELLKKKYNLKTYIYGDLSYNINAKNLVESFNYISSVHYKNDILLIDATLGENVGEVIFSKGAYAGLGKVLPIKKIGNFSILGVVGKSGKDFRLNTLKLSVVLNMAEIISKAIYMAFSVKYENKNVI